MTPHIPLIPPFNGRLNPIDRLTIPLTDRI